MTPLGYVLIFLSVLILAGIIAGIVIAVQHTDATSEEQQQEEPSNEDIIRDIQNHFVPTLHPDLLPSVFHSVFMEQSPQEQDKAVTGTTKMRKMIYKDPAADSHRLRQSRSGRELLLHDLDELNAKLNELFQASRYEYQVTPWKASFFWNQPTSKPRFSIVMPVFNQESIICRTLQGIMSCTKDEFELIVLFDGCTDNSEAVATEWLSKNHDTLNSWCTSIMLIHLGESVFETAADNLGFRLSSAPTIVEIQADMTMIESGYNLRLEAPLLEYTDIFAVSGRCAHNATDFIGMPFTFQDNTDQWRNDECYLMATVNRGPLLLDKDKLQQCGYLDEKHYALGNDDHDLCFRAWSQFGYRAAYVKIKVESDLEDGTTRKPMAAGQKHILQIRRPQGLLPIQYAKFAIATSRPLNLLRPNRMAPTPPHDDESKVFSPQRVTLVLFANTQSIHYNNAELCVLAAAHYGQEFGSVKLYNEHDVEDFIKLLPPDALSARGYNYWSWKPYIIMKAMEQAEFNDMVVYVDSGMFFNNPRFLQAVLNLTGDSEQGSTFFRIGHNVVSHCKCEVWPEFEEQAESLSDFMVDASLLFLRNNHLNFKLMEQWTSLILTPNYVSDSVTKTCSNSADFKDHRHDQALLTIVLRNNKIPFWVQKDGLVHHHRTRTQEEFNSLWDRLGLGHGYLCETSE